MRLHFAERNVVSHIRNTEKINLFFRGGGGEAREGISVVLKYQIRPASIIF